MICSMTGFGSATGDCATGTGGKLGITVELKSVNNRFLDCSVKLPRSYAFAEEAVKKLAQARLVRGKLDVFVNIDASASDEVTVRLNEPLLRAYMAAFQRMEQEFGVRNDAGAVAYSRMPDLFTTEKQPVDAETFSQALADVTAQALDALCAMRAREGARLTEDILEKLAALEAQRQQVAARSPETVAAYQARLLERMQEVLGAAGVDESRILTEAALYADKVAVDEELVRLDSHIRQLRELLTAGGAVGRKLDFLIQELNREVNTIGSKCVDLEITKVVVEMKAGIEKIREQAQNIE